MATIQEQARALGDPTRFAIFEFLRSQDHGRVDVAALTDHVGLHHNAIRQHLAKLVDAELVVETQAAPDGPGRPRLNYAIAPATESRWGVTGPYERLSRLLAEVIRSGDTPVEVGRRNIEAHGPAADPDEAVDVLADAMARQGFAPEVRPRRGGVDIVLRQCPFASAALEDPDTVCQLHLGLAEGIALDSGAIRVDGLTVTDPRQAKCRISVVPATD